ncbi:hypothetical protein CMK22_20225 [Candidatus Poribacteria bacterium]|nr:hypothetical protein [Candidatus Poribacteria bacterium]
MTTTVHWLISRYVQAAEPKILFVSNRGNSKDIWIMKSDGQAPKNLTKSRKTNEETPTASPKGIHITFSADGGKNKARWTYIMSLDGKGKTRNITKGEGESNPVWSPTGTEIAYTALAGKSLSIYILSLWNWTPRISIKAIETTEPFNVTDAPPTDTHPTAKRLHLVLNRDGDLEIHTMDVVLDKPDPENPPGLLQLTKNEVVDWQPNWSPDGTKIAFSSKRDGNWEIYVMDANGQNQVNLTNNPAKDITATWLSQTLPEQAVDANDKSATAWGKIKTAKIHQEQ